MLEPRGSGSVGVSGLARKCIKAAVLPLGLPVRRRPGDVIVFVYHRVGAGHREIDLPLSQFERQAASLAARERVRPLEEALADDEGGLVMTFDDGSRDFHEHVLPILERHRLPVTLYLATGLVSNGRPSGTAPPEPLTWPMLEEAVASGLVTVGAHTHTHANLSAASEKAAEEEMRRSKDLVEDRLGTECRDFAYPWGVASVGADRAARRLFRTAALDAWKTNRRGRVDPHRLGRTPILRSDGSVFFGAKVKGLLQSEALAYRMLRRGPWGTN